MTPKEDAIVPIYFIGDSQRAEFRQAAVVLEAWGRVERFADPAVAALALESGALVEVIVVAQSHPGQFTAGQIDRLRRAAPLARMVGLLGSWCEGESRSGQPWPGVTRLYWHQFAPRAAQELAALVSGRPTSWSLPATASDEERLLATPIEEIEPRSGLIVLCARSWLVEDMLRDACRQRGYATAWVRPPDLPRIEGVTAALLDTADQPETDLQDLAALVAAVKPAPVVALANFPRIEDREQLLRSDAVAVLSKPIQLAELYAELDRIEGLKVVGTRRVP